jgi:hypothetical protein
MKPAIPNSKVIQTETAGLLPIPTRNSKFRVNSKNLLKQVKSAFQRSISRHESALSGLELSARNFQFRVGQQQRNLNLELLV